MVHARAYIVWQGCTETCRVQINAMLGIMGWLEALPLTNSKVRLLRRFAGLAWIWLLVRVGNVLVNFVNNVKKNYGCWVKMVGDCDRSLRGRGTGCKVVEVDKVADSPGSQWPSCLLDFFLSGFLSLLLVFPGALSQSFVLSGCNSVPSAVFLCLLNEP